MMKKRQCLGGKVKGFGLPFATSSAVTVDRKRWRLVEFVEIPESALPVSSGEQQQPLHK